MVSLKQNIWMSLAAFLMFVTLCVHVFLGGNDVYNPARTEIVDPELRSVLSVVWHMVSLELALCTAALILLTQTKNPALFIFCLVTMVGTAILFIGYTLFDFGSIWALPQWIAFVGVSGLMIVSWCRP